MSSYKIPSPWVQLPHGDGIIPGKSYGFWDFPLLPWDIRSHFMIFTLKRSKIVVGWNRPKFYSYWRSLECCLRLCSRVMGRDGMKRGDRTEIERGENEVMTRPNQELFPPKGIFPVLPSPFLCLFCSLSLYPEAAPAMGWECCRLPSGVRGTDRSCISVYLEPSPWWLLGFHFCWTKSENRNKCVLLDSTSQCFKFRMYYNPPNYGLGFWVGEERRCCLITLSTLTTDHDWPLQPCTMYRSM